MWLFTQTGFISAILKDNGILVRSRDLQSLTPLATFSGSSIIKTPTADYPYRIHLARDLFEHWVALQAQAIDYPNFKSRVADTRGYHFAAPLHQVWSIMHEVEDAEARL